MWSAEPERSEGDDFGVPVPGRWGTELPLTADYYGLNALCTGGSGGWGVRRLNFRLNAI